MTANPLNLANALTMLRVLLVGPFIWLIWEGRFSAALVVFLIAGLTDYLDGLAARLLHQETAFGRLVDPIADKLLTTAAFVVLAVSRGGLPTIPVWLTASVVGRDVVIGFGSLLIYLIVGFTDFKPSIAGKINTFLEIVIIAAFLFAGASGFLGGLLPAGYAIVLVSVAVSGIGYVVKGVTIYRVARVGPAAKSTGSADPAN
ncbi:MAG TPA: CDP-alcohol phosphatidyltransferase family protein [Blastocatellia bacterium]|nr:CDP-alcohol phosphatidyltransferase family protein [Blastocatellia bacterium]